VPVVFDRSQPGGSPGKKPDKAAKPAKAAAPAQPAKPAKSAKAAKGKDAEDNKPKIIALSVVTVLALGFVAWWLFFSGSSEPNVTNVPPTAPPAATTGAPVTGAQPGAGPARRGGISLQDPAQGPGGTGRPPGATEQGGEGIHP
jgi:hypothetical protein